MHNPIQKYANQKDLNPKSNFRFSNCFLNTTTVNFGSFKPLVNLSFHSKNYNNGFSFNKSKPKQLVKPRNELAIQTSKLNAFISPVILPNKAIDLSNFRNRYKRELPHFISKQELIANSVSESVAKQYLRYGEYFSAWLLQQHNINNNIPLYSDLIKKCDIIILDSLIGDFLTFKFNKTLNTGGTLHNTVCGILYKLALDNIHLTAEMLPSVRRICKGANNVLNKYVGINAQKGKRAILNPILEALLKHANPNEKFALLFATRFCLRSQHYCYVKTSDVSKINYITRDNVFFEPSNVSKPTAMVIANTKDKNHQSMHYMERTVYCSCHTPWSCVVCIGKKYFDSYSFLPNTATFIRDSNNNGMTYTTMLDIVKKLIKLEGLDPSEYGTHSCRAGGTSEFFLLGKGAIWIQNFAHWKNIGSVLVYIRPNNPDLRKYVTSVANYCDLRKLEGQSVVGSLDNLSCAVLEVQKQSKKMFSGNKLHGRYRAILCQQASLIADKLKVNTSFQFNFDSDLTSVVNKKLKVKKLKNKNKSSNSDVIIKKIISKDNSYFEKTLYPNGSYSVRYMGPNFDKTEIE